jgi:diamine N-acetyltransferase
MHRGRLVYLRPAERTDIPTFVRWLSDERTTRNLDLRSPIGLAMEERWFEDLLEHHGRDRWLFVICRLRDGRPVGSLDLHELDLTNGGCGLGIVIGDPADRSQGYGGDAIGALLAFAFQQLRLERVWLDVYAGNPTPAGCTSGSSSTCDVPPRRHRAGHYDDVQDGDPRSEWADRG